MTTDALDRIGRVRAVNFAPLRGLDQPIRTEAEALRERVERRFGVKVRTSFDYPPIPVRDCDWSAVTDDYDGAEDAGPQACGRGRTEADAIADLEEQLEDR